MSSMKRSKKKQRVWKSGPAPWRRRFPSIIENLCNDAQRRLETAIGWGSHRPYSKSFSMASEDEMLEHEAVRDLVIQSFRFIMPDNTSIIIHRNPFCFGWLIRVNVSGVTPKLRRDRIARETTA